MKLTKYGENVKIGLAIELEKIGSSIFELEHALQNLNTVDGMKKMAFLGEKLLSEVSTEAIKAAPEALLKGTLAGGVVSGMAFDELDKSVEEANKAILKEQEKINLVRRMTENIKKEHGLL
jgi:hypothetical protein